MLDNSLPGTVWRHRWLLVSLTGREFRSRYNGSVVGVLWLLLHPMALLAIYTLLFRVVFRVGFPELDQVPFVVFVSVALWPWLAFSEGLQRGTTAVTNNAGLVKKVAFPSELVVYAHVTVAFLVHGGGFLLVGVVLALWGTPWLWNGLPVAAAWWLVLWLLCCSLALVAAAVHVFIRDVEHLLSHLLMAGFYLTPVLYPLSMVPEWLAAVMAFNPLATAVEGLRAALLFGGGAGLRPLFGGLMLALLLLTLARWCFCRVATQFEDQL